MVESPSYRFTFVLPDEIGAHRDFFFGYFRTSVRHMLFVDLSGSPLPVSRLGEQRISDRIRKYEDRSVLPSKRRSLSGASHAREIK